MHRYRGGSMRNSRPMRNSFYELGVRTSAVELQGDEPPRELPVYLRSGTMASNEPSSHQSDEGYNGLRSQGIRHSLHWTHESQARPLSLETNTASPAFSPPQSATSPLSMTTADASSPVSQQTCTPTNTMSPNGIHAAHCYMTPDMSKSHTPELPSISPIQFYNGQQMDHALSHYSYGNRQIGSPTAPVSSNGQQTGAAMYQNNVINDSISPSASVRNGSSTQHAVDSDVPSHNLFTNANIPEPHHYMRNDGGAFPIQHPQVSRQHLLYNMNAAYSRYNFEGHSRGLPGHTYMPALQQYGDPLENFESILGPLDYEDPPSYSPTGHYMPPLPVIAQASNVVVDGSQQPHILPSNPMRQHSRARHDVPSMACDDCGEVFTGTYAKGNRTRHYKLKHMLLEQSSCRECGVLFNRADACKNHEWKKHRIPGTKSVKRKKKEKKEKKEKRIYMPPMDDVEDLMDIGDAY
ncbi:hypothetical protein BU24DRAFT_458714 [Aaosphaeria arxii CBS 175.79]|uniref:C2H2-type domain-containing protein n=1 Tax=Aaosphaeria arxii CBS 175.79 TaxID=1450172 RepID=A0A6A5Y339_9PLEO|nr:uncharacterized protein BU24DRAFT_458714 [Aaosphaeria arxii CBS 175.79]KAF2018994.1 hypothetical protein BU24DRAFT_458714 [Aaosphaeria arxii CBS 175.79]